jgi:histidine ammonia-lyase
MRHLLRDSTLIKSHHAGTHKVQDPYSLRCVPQVHGAAWDALAHVRHVLEIEINAVTDNPLVFADGADVDPHAAATGGGRVVSGGNFHGEPIALALDFMKIAIAEIGSISERRVAQLVDAKSSGLPPFLVKDAGLNSGLMLFQYTAAALVSENKVLAHPASVDSIPTSAGQEDHVSMGPIAARQANAIVRNVEHVVALELLCAAQGLDFRLESGLALGAGVAEAHRRVRAKVAHRADDRDPGPEIAAASDLVRHGRLVDLVDLAD